MIVLSDYLKIHEIEKWVNDALTLIGLRGNYFGETYPHWWYLHELGLRYFISIDGSLRLNQEGMSLLYPDEENDFPEVVEFFRKSSAKNLIDLDGNRVAFFLASEQIENLANMRIIITGTPAPKFDAPPTRLSWSFDTILTCSEKYPKVVLEDKFEVCPFEEAYKLDYECSEIYALKADVEQLVRDFSTLEAEKFPEGSSPFINERLQVIGMQSKGKQEAQQATLKSISELTVQEKRQIFLKGWLLGKGFSIGHYFEDKKRLDIWNELSSLDSDLFPPRPKVDSSINSFFNNAKLCRFKKGR